MKKLVGDTSKDTANTGLCIHNALSIEFGLDYIARGGVVDELHELFLGDHSGELLGNLAVVKDKAHRLLVHQLHRHHHAAATSNLAHRAVNKGVKEHFMITTPVEFQTLEQWL